MSEDEQVQESDNEVKEGDMSWLFPNKEKEKPGVSPHLVSSMFSSAISPLGLILHRPFLYGTNVP